MAPTLKWLVLAALGLAVTTAAKLTALPPPPEHAIKAVTGQTFRELVVDPTLPVLLGFVPFGNAKSTASFAAMLDEVSEKLDGYALFRVMDSVGEEGKGLAQMFGVQRFPAFLYFNPELLPVEGGQEGQYMKAPLQYQGPLSVGGLAAFVLMGMASHQLERLADLQDAEDFVAKYALQDVPKVILFFNDSVVPPMFKVTSHYHRYGAIFGVVNVTTPEAAEIAAKYGVSDVPTVITVAGEDVDKLVDQPAGSITLAELNAFVGRHALDKEKKAQLQGYFIETEIAARRKAQEEAKMNKALPPLIISTEQEWKENCLERRKGYCVACFVENPAAVDIEMLAETGRKMVQRSTHAAQVVVVDGAANLPIAEFFSATNGFPEVVFINPSKKTYHNLVGSFNVRSLVNFFVEKVTATRGTRYFPTKVPAFQRSQSSSGNSAEA